MAALTLEQLQNKTQRQVERLIENRLRKLPGATEQQERLILADLHQLIIADRLTESEWNKVVMASVDKKYVDNWSYAGLNGKTIYRQGRQGKLPDLHKLDRVTIKPVKTTKSDPEPPAEKSKGQHGGFRKGAGEATGQRSRQHLEPILPIISKGLEAGKTLQAIADELNDKGFKTQTGRTFQRNHVHKIIKRRQLRNKVTV